MARTQIYCDPSLSTLTGDGSVGTPYGVASGSVVQWVLDNVSRDVTNGNQINIKAGTADTLGAALSFTTWGSPGEEGTIFRGYTSAADDGGIGEIDGAATYSIVSDTATDHMAFVDMKIGNCGAAIIMTVDDHWTFYNVEFHGTSTDGLKVNTGDATTVVSCYFHDIGGDGIIAGDTVYGCYFKNDGTNDFDNCIVTGTHVLFNIISIDGASNGISNNGTGNLIAHNSVLSASGTGIGIASGSGNGSSKESPTIVSNIVEGFSGTGGIGYELRADDIPAVIGLNSAYNNTTNYNDGGKEFVNLGDNETLTVTGFAKSGSDTFANRLTYFAPVDTDNIIGSATAGGYPIGSYIDKGAVQNAPSAGGGGGGIAFAIGGSVGVLGF